MTSCDRCHDLHDWAENSRQAAVCPVRVAELAAARCPRHRDFRHVRRIAEDATLWRPFVITMAIGICSHPAQDTWTTAEIEQAIAGDIYLRAIDQILGETAPRRKRTT